MNPSVSRTAVLSLAVATGLCVASLSPLGAQTAQITGNVASTIVASDTAVGPSVGYNNPQYIADRSPGSNYSGVTQLLFKNSLGIVTSGCTGSYLGNGKILTAAHCVSNGTSITSSSFTARFFQSDVGWFDVQGSGYSVKPGYSGAVINENDVAVLTLASAAPTFARTYGLATGSMMGLTEQLAGYGLTGTGATGAVVNDGFFTDAARIRTGNNTFETTGNTAGSFATSSNPAYGDFGGVLLLDIDRSGMSTAGFMCNGLGFCNAGYGGYREVGIGAGDSGSGSFLSDWSITGVASWTETSGGVGGKFGQVQGYTCVANVVTNLGCESNYAFVQSELVVATPEPASFLLTATGLASVIGFVRRRRRTVQA